MGFVWVDLCLFLRGASAHDDDEALGPGSDSHFCSPIVAELVLVPKSTLAQCQPFDGAAGVS